MEVFIQVYYNIVEITRFINLGGWINGNFNNDGILIEGQSVYKGFTIF